MSKGRGKRSMTYKGQLVPVWAFYTYLTLRYSITLSTVGVEYLKATRPLSLGS